MTIVNFKNGFKAILNDEHTGSEAVESVILTPLMFITFIILLYFFFMGLTFISYNNVANSIAMELNMRQSGYETAMRNYPTAPQILTYVNSTTTSDGLYPRSAYLSASKINVSPNTQELKSGTYFALTKYQKQFLIPFAQLNGIEVTTTKPIKYSMGKQLAGTVVKVKVHYNTMTFGEQGHGLIPMTAVGYGIIS